MSLKDSYTLDAIKETNKIPISAETFAVCELLEHILGSLNSINMRLKKL